MNRTREEILQYEVQLGTLYIKWRIVNGQPQNMSSHQATATQGREPPTPEQLAEAGRLFAMAARDAGFKVKRGLS